MTEPILSAHVLRVVGEAHPADNFTGFGSLNCVTAQISSQSNCSMKKFVPIYWALLAVAVPALNQLTGALVRLDEIRSRSRIPYALSL